VKSANSAPAPSGHASLERWTALEVFTAIAPHRVSRLRDPQSAFEAETRRAHKIAVAEGYGWSHDGRYPLDVWMKVFQ
jgi:hypothetical protein